MLQRFVDQAAVEAEIAHATVPWTVPAAAPVNGIVHVPAHNTPMKLGHREVLLIAIAKARKWIKDVERGHSFAAIARREGKAEQHIRNLAPLAFVSPRIITAIMDGTAPAGLTATALARPGGQSLHHNQSARPATGVGGTAHSTSRKTANAEA